jgi:signal recognition particle subunit SRP54
MTVTEVNALVNRFESAAKMMKTVARGGTPNIPGMGPMPGARAKAKPLAKKSSKSGNPAKRAAENAAISSAPAITGNAFGVGEAAEAPSDKDMETMRKLLERGGL